MEGTSLNIKDDLIKRLKEIIPAAFSEDKLSTEKLRQILGEAVNADTERYQLNWAGKSEAYRVIQTPVTDTLIPDFNSSLNWDSAEHIMIEGENLKTLKVLQRSYSGKIQLISIDPPYNTGSGSFVYADKYAESKEGYLKRSGQKAEGGSVEKKGLFKATGTENGQVHSNWLSMMLPRLSLARNLLSEAGAILVHIDENEQPNLSLLLNEIFGEENLIGNIIWDKGNPKGDARGIAYRHEIILVYAKNKEKFFSEIALKRRKKNAERIIKKAADLYKRLHSEELPEEIAKLHKEHGLPDELLAGLRRKITPQEINKQFYTWLKKQELSGGELAYNKIDDSGDVYRLVSMAWPNKKKAPDDYFIPLIHPKTKKACPVPQRGWRFPPKTINKLIADGEIIFGADESVQPQRKYLLKENLFENIPSVLFYGGSDDDLLRKLGLQFENPKPVEFTKTLILALTKPNDDHIVLDFFAGSGTTAAAVIDANKEDGGNRKFICIQLPEKLTENSDMFIKGFRSISDITNARIRSAVENINTEMNAGENSAGAGQVGFRSFYLANSNFKNWRHHPANNDSDLIARINLFNRPVKKKFVSVDVLWELLIKNGLTLTEKTEKINLSKTEQFFVADAGRMAFCLDYYSSAIEDEILKIKPAVFICADSLFEKKDSFKNNAYLKFRDNGIEFKTI